MSRGNRRVECCAETPFPVTELRKEINHRVSRQSRSKLWVILVRDWETDMHLPRRVAIATDDKSRLVLVEVPLVAPGFVQLGCDEPISTVLDYDFSLVDPVVGNAKCRDRAFGNQARCDFGVFQGERLLARTLTSSSSMPSP